MANLREDSTVRTRTHTAARWVAAVALIVAMCVAVRFAQPVHADPSDTWVTPTTGLVDGQFVDLAVTDMPAGSTYLVVECGPQAVTLLTGGWPNGNRNPMDGCESQQNTVLFAHDTGAPSGHLQVRAILNAAIGPIDCRVDDACFIALFPLQGSAPLKLINITFAAEACAAPGSCESGVVPGIAGHSTPAPADPTPAPAPIASVTSAHPATVSRDAWVAGDLTAIGAEAGPVTGPLEQHPPPSSPVTGEGMVRLILAAPGTDYGANLPTAVVVDVAIDDGTTQQMVLFRGATPFVYAGFTGPLSTGSHDVNISVNTTLSSTRGAPQTVDVRDVQLQVVAPDNPSYREFAYAPVMYGRSTSALHDTPLLQYAKSTPNGGGSTRLDYTAVFTHENAGTAFIPFMESGAWGRMSDIESYFSTTVSAAGATSNSTFFSGAVPDDYPDGQNAIDEVDVPFIGTWIGHHPALRVATGNNDFSQAGTTGFRIQMPPVAAPGPGQPREAVMDANPWTYRVMGEEIARWYTNFTTDPSVPEQGDARQYAYVELRSSGSAVTSIGIDIQLNGDPTWYANDFGSGFDLAGTGLKRTVVKLPVGWADEGIAAVRLRVFPASSTSSVSVQLLSVGALSPTWTFSLLQAPTPTVVNGFLFVPPTTTTTTTTSTSTTTTIVPSAPATTPSLAPNVPAVSTSLPPSVLLHAGTSPVDNAGGRTTRSAASPAVAVAQQPTYTG